MKTRKRFFAATLAFALSLAALSSAPLAPRATAADAGQQEQQQVNVLERGYRTGYSDGYQAGWGDTQKRAASDYRGKEDYRRADRAYVATYGSLEDYRDGYRQGFEAGYNAGYSRRGFDSTVPAGLSRRGVTEDDNGADGDARSDNVATVPANDDDDDDARSGQNSGSSSNGNGGSTRGVLRRSIPSDTTLRVELLNRLSTDVSQRGDRFEARVVEPSEYEGAIVSGKLTNVQRSGKSRGRSQLQLDFDQMRMPNSSDWLDFSAQVIEVINTGDDDSVGEVDPEGGVRGKSTTREDVAKVGAGAGVGAIIGAIAGGGKGAAIGAILGGGAGTAGVMTQRGKDIRLEAGQQLRIRTTGHMREN
ncbi:MAG TPA: hypothetical protein VM934_15855 [Pyrinomonadaceae bacterium]|nr:hypothetical protein [Pyrinomonadaceae bacterium]